MTVILIVLVVAVIVAVRLRARTPRAAPARGASGVNRRVGEIVHGVVRGVTSQAIDVSVEMSRVTFPTSEQVPGETYRVGDTLEAYCDENSDGVFLTRASDHFVAKLFEREVIEIRQCVVRLTAIARQPGVRTKVAVASSDDAIDPVDACVGVSGDRIRRVVAALGVEPIDIVPYDAKPAMFVSNAIAPGEVKRIVIDEADHRMELVITDDTLAKAIGEAGINARLAAQLTGWRLDLFSVTKYAAAERDAKAAIATIVADAGLDATLTDTLFKNGWRSARQIAVTEIEELVPHVGGAENAEKLRTMARALIAAN